MLKTIIVGAVTFAAGMATWEYVKPLIGK